MLMPLCYQPVLFTPQMCVQSRLCVGVQNLWSMRREESTQGLLVFCLSDAPPDLRLSAALLQQRTRLRYVLGNPCCGEHLERVHVRDAEAMVLMADLYALYCVLLSARSTHATLTLLDKIVLRFTVCNNQPEATVSDQLSIILIQRILFASKVFRVLRDRQPPVRILKIMNILRLLMGFC